MNYTITLPDGFESMDIRTLLEKEWLVPRKVRHFLRTRKNVLLNGEPAMFHLMVKAGDELTLSFDPTDYTLPEIKLGQKELIDILYEDEHLIILNKPTGMKTHPNEPTETDTLLNHLAAYLATDDLFPYVVHRLDKETSGAICFAKNPFILPILGRLLEAKEIKRTYHGIAQGRIRAKEFTVTKNISRDRHDQRKRVATDRGGQHAVTHFTLVNQIGNEAYLECQLETGRTHQIRVHLASLGHPLIGDPLYNPKARGSQRLMLHAAELSLHHPLTKELISVKALPSLWEA